MKSSPKKVLNNIKKYYLSSFVNFILDPIDSFIPNNKIQLINDYQKEFMDFTYIPETTLSKTVSESNQE